MIARILLIALLVAQMIVPVLPNARASPAATEPCCCAPGSCGCEDCACVADDDPQPTTPAPAQRTTSLREMTWAPLQTDGFGLPPVDARPMPARAFADARGCFRLPNEVSLARVCVRMT